MALAFLGERPGTFCSVREIVDHLKIPKRLLAEVLKDLSHEDFLESIRGPGGGYRLLQRPGNIPLVEIITALDGPLRMTECSGDGDCEHEAACVISSGISRVSQDIASVLEKHTLADLTSTHPKTPLPAIQV